MHGPLPSNLVSLVKRHQSELQLPEQADSAKDDVRDYDAIPNEPANYSMDTDMDTGMDTDMDMDKDDLQFCVVRADGQLLADAPSKHHQRERQKFVDFDAHKAGMLAKYAKLVTANVGSCKSAKEVICHKILDASDHLMQSNSCQLGCCDLSPGQSGHVVQLFTQDCSEKVECHTCSNHSVSSLLMGLGFMVNKCRKPDLS
ncbi:hypothetical protein BJ741DRAFT_673309 [Chytriomyces cf. hyalinus JEL632]|nr:hypothetical protein BJ741DRAFT_673309 [Chytriomyces cf. hyalinus JEL632]